MRFLTGLDSVERGVSGTSRYDVFGVDGHVEVDRSSILMVVGVSFDEGDVLKLWMI